MVSGASHTASVYLTLTISYDRYMAICRPFSRQRLTQNLQIILVLVISVFLSPTMVYLPPWFLDLYLSQNWIFLSGLAFTLRALFELFLPLIAISVLSVLVSIELRNSDAKWANSLSTMRRQESSTITKLLMTIVTVFILCHIPSVMYTILTAIFYFSHEREEYRYTLSDVLWDNLNILFGSFQMLNSSCNFIIYAARDKNFRAALKSLFVRRQSRNTSGQKAGTSATC